MSDVAAQELVVDASLAGELERRGVHVHAGDRVRLELVTEAAAPAADELWDAFVGRFESPEPHLAARAKRLARAEMAR